jgi:hypothetical protein
MFQYAILEEGDNSDVITITQKRVKCRVPKPNGKCIKVVLRKKSQQTFINKLCPMVLQPTTETARTFDTTNTKLYLGYRVIFFIKAGCQ